MQRDNSLVIRYFYFVSFHIGFIANLSFSFSACFVRVRHNFLSVHQCTRTSKQPIALNVMCICASVPLCINACVCVYVTLLVGNPTFLACSPVCVCVFLWKRLFLFQVFVILASICATRTSQIGKRKKENRNESL